MEAEMMDLIDPVSDTADELPVLPLPKVVDTPAVVFVGLLSGGTRPLVLDARAVREVQATAAPLLVSLLRAKREAGVPARIEGATAAVLRFAGLAEYAATAASGDESFFVCPDRDVVGFSPSPR
jgi:hypothetical protein